MRTIHLSTRAAGAMAALATTALLATGGGRDAMAQADQPDSITSTAAAWSGQYFANRDLAGPAVMVREDPSLDFDWGRGSPAAGVVPADNFSVRWQRYIDAPAGRFRVDVTHDDGVRVYVDGRRIVDAWFDQASTSRRGELEVASGSHLVVVEYYEHAYDARIRVDAGPVAAAPVGWRGTYFTNPDLSGSGAFTRDDPSIDFDWRYGSPQPGVIPAERFSVRWLRQIGFAPGSYRFVTTTDDGVRLWVNGNLLIDRWIPQGVTSHEATIYLPGAAEVRMEYFEATGAAVAKLRWEAVGGGGGSAGEVVVDELSPGFVRGGSATGWQRAAAGSGGSYWALNNQVQQPDYNWARWYVTLTPGRYEVFAFIPSRNANTRSARYWVAHADGFGSRVVNQLVYSDVWVSLGTYRFAGTGQEYAALNDITGEARLSRRIGFDAVKFVPR